MVLRSCKLFGKAYSDGRWTGWLTTWYFNSFQLRPLDGVLFDLLNELKFIPLISVEFCCIEVFFFRCILSVIKRRAVTFNWHVCGDLGRFYSHLRRHRAAACRTTAGTNRTAYSCVAKFFGYAVATVQLVMDFAYSVRLIIYANWEGGRRGEGG